MFRGRIALLALLAVIGALIAVPLAAQGRGHTTWIVRDGFYAGMEGPTGPLAFFHVKHRRVYHLRFSLNLDCHNSNTGQSYPALFSAGSGMPQGLRIPANGTLTINWRQDDAGRNGHINAQLSFHRHPLASFSVQGGGGYENCVGFSAVRVHRAPHTPPVPQRP